MAVAFVLLTAVFVAAFSETLVFAALVFAVFPVALTVVLTAAFAEVFAVDFAAVVLATVFTGAFAVVFEFVDDDLAAAGFAVALEDFSAIFPTQF